MRTLRRRCTRRGAASGRWRDGGGRRRRDEAEYRATPAADLVEAQRTVIVHGPVAVDHVLVVGLLAALGLGAVRGVRQDVTEVEVDARPARARLGDAMVPVLLGGAAHHQKVAVAKSVLAHGRPVIDAVAAAAAIAADATGVAAAAAATTTAAGDAVAAAGTAAAADAGPYIEHAAELELAGRAERQRPDRRRRPEEGAPVSVVPARRQ